MIRLLLSLFIFALLSLVSSSVVFAEEPDIEINIYETISVGDTRNTEKELFKEEIQVTEALMPDTDVIKESIDLVDEIDVEVFGEPIKVETEVSLESDENTENTIDNIESITIEEEPDEETTKDSGRKIKVSSGSSSDVIEDTVVVGQEEETVELDELLDTRSTETQQKHSVDIDANTQIKDEKLDSKVVPESKDTEEIGGSCSSTQNQTVDASTILMGMILVPIIFRRKRS